MEESKSLSRRIDIIGRNLMTVPSSPKILVLSFRPFLNFKFLAANVVKQALCSSQATANLIARNMS